MEQLKVFKLKEFHKKNREGDVIHSLLTEEFFFTMDLRRERNWLKFIPLYPQRMQKLREDSAV